MNLTPLRTVTVRKSGPMFLVNCSCDTNYVDGAREPLAAEAKATRHNYDKHRGEYDVETTYTDRAIQGHPGAA